MICEIFVDIPLLGKNVSKVYFSRYFKFVTKIEKLACLVIAQKFFSKT